MEKDQIRLIEAFASLLGEMPFDSITPRRITDRAELPSSRFAYWYHDVYAIADALFEAEGRSLSESDISPETGGEAFLLSVSFVIRNPASARNIAFSSGVGIYKRYVSSLSGKYFSEAVLKRLGGREPGERERDAVRFLRAAAVGLATRELIQSDDPKATAERYCDFFDEIVDKINV
jgi:AcrR family transcriptional regulator